MMKLSEVLPHFDGQKVKLANALGISKQAISAWKDRVPVEQELRLRYEIMPEIFGARKTEAV